jgi:streptomycin 6-kinase
MMRCGGSCFRSRRGEVPAIVPERLVVACRGVPEREAWLERLPEAIRELQERWSLSLGAPFDNDDTSCAWVAQAMRADGTRTVLKLGMPHMEGAHELDGLRFWDGDPTVRLLEADAGLNAMILEACEPGTSLRDQGEPEQDVVIAGLLRRLWRRPSSPHPFRPLSTMLEHWAEETKSAAGKWRDTGMVRAGLRLFSELAAAAHDDVLLATDLHSGNVLRAQREPWLVIDPKPFVGDRAYDATQHLFNCRQRLLDAPRDTISRFAHLLELSADRVRLWMFARAAAEPRDIWDDESVALARGLQ